LVDLKVTSTDIKNNFGKYIRLAAKEDILITKNGKTIGRLTAYTEDDAADSYVLSTKENAPSYSNDRKKVTFEEFMEISSNSSDYIRIEGIEFFH
jgi:prevent-host-death family protein